MERYDLLILPSVYNDLDKIPKKDRTKIIGNIWDLAIDPRPVKSTKLSGDDRCRVRQGNYRILYRIEDKQLIVTVVKVAHRKDIYRK